MVRTAVIKMETNLSQEEFEKWLLKLIKDVAVDPDKSEVLQVSSVLDDDPEDLNYEELPDCPWYGNCGERLIVGSYRKCRREEGVCNDR